eukprot:1190814-Prorocentrum_minimum.AAC.1
MGGTSAQHHCQRCYVDERGRPHTGGSRTFGTLPACAETCHAAAHNSPPSAYLWQGLWETEQVKACVL